MTTKAPAARHNNGNGNSKKDGESKCDVQQWQLANRVGAKSDPSAKMSLFADGLVWVELEQYFEDELVLAGNVVRIRLGDGAEVGVA